MQALMRSPQHKRLRMAFCVGAVTDALAIIPMTVRPVAKLLWNVSDGSGAYRFAMGYGTSLMLGWTALLVWAYRRPVERRRVASLTILVICGFIATEVIGMMSGDLAPWRFVPTLFLQALLLTLFVVALPRQTTKSRPEAHGIAGERIGRTSGRVSI